MAAEFARDKEGTLRDLQECIEKSHHRHGLGGLRYEELDEVGPGYAIQAPHPPNPGLTAEEEAATSTKAK
jgi:hypothetical protein